MAKQRMRDLPNAWSRQDASATWIDGVPASKLVLVSGDDLYNYISVLALGKVVSGSTDLIRAE